MSVYADSSFFVALYIPDVHSRQAELWWTGSSPIFLTPLVVAEWTHAVEQQVFRGRISPSEATRLHDRFLQQRRARTWEEVLVPESAYSKCIELGLQYAAALGLRTIDTLHVACAIELGARIFRTFDQRQLRLAKACGSKVD